MRAVDKADAHQRGFRTKNIGVNAVERVTAVVVVAVAGRTGKQVVRYAVFRKRRKHFFRIPVADLLNMREIRHNFALSLPAERADFL